MQQTQNKSKKSIKYLTFKLWTSYVKGLLNRLNDKNIYVSVYSFNYFRLMISVMKRLTKVTLA